MYIICMCDVCGGVGCCFASSTFECCLCLWCLCECVCVHVTDVLYKHKNEPKHTNFRFSHGGQTPEICSPIPIDTTDYCEVVSAVCFICVLLCCFGLFVCCCVVLFCVCGCVVCFVCVVVLFVLCVWLCCC